MIYYPLALTHIYHIHILYQNVLLFSGKRDCIKHDGEMISPLQFEQRGGKESSKCWKTSILCQGKPLKSLMEVRTGRDQNIS